MRVLMKAPPFGVRIHAALGQLFSSFKLEQRNFFSFNLSICTFFFFFFFFFFDKKILCDAFLIVAQPMKTERKRGGCSPLRGEVCTH